jgi:hypothetical protein
VNGSIYAELQYWKVDVENSSAILYEKERRMVGKKDKALNVELLVKPLAQAISECRNNPCLRWDSDSKVKVLIAKSFRPRINKPHRQGERGFGKVLNPKSNLLVGGGHLPGPSFCNGNHRLKLTPEAKGALFQLTSG